MLSHYNAIKISENLKVILLTATPMKNLADDVVDLLNFLRPSDDLIKRDRVFTGEKNWKVFLFGIKQAKHLF